MKNCPKCNAELNDDVVFCTECGETLEVVETAPEAEVVENAPKAEVVTEAPKKKASLILGIVSLVFGVLALPGHLIGGLIPFIGFLITGASGFGTFVSFVVSIVGLIFGVKETKAGGKKIGLILNIAALVLAVIVFILGIIGTILSLVLVGAGMMGSSGLDFFELIEEILWELGLY